MKFFFWKLRYAWYMNKKIRDLKASFSMAFNCEHDYWFESEPKGAVDEELSYWVV